MNLNSLVICALALLMASCSTMNSITGNTGVSYSETARQNFESGEKAFKEGNFDEAIAFFDHVRTKYPYTKYAAESDLKVADSFFAQEKWLEAVDAYDFFIRFHPVHESLPHAFFRVAKSNFNAMPSNFFLFPSGYTKDQTATKQALEAIDRYLTEFPNDSNVKEAKEMRVELREQVAMQHMDVARFYAKRSKWRGAALRYDEVIKQFSETPSARRAFLELAQIKSNYLLNKAEARELLLRLMKEHPNSKEAKEAASAINDIKEDQPSASAS